MSPEQLAFIIGSIYGSTLTLLLSNPGRRSRNRRDPFLDCRDRRGSYPPSPNTKPQPPSGPPKPEFPPGRVTDVHGRTIGYRSINYPDPSPDRRPTNPFNGEHIPDPSPRKP